MYRIHSWERTILWESPYKMCTKCVQQTVAVVFRLVDIASDVLSRAAAIFGWQILEEDRPYRRLVHDFSIGKQLGEYPYRAKTRGKASPVLLWPKFGRVCGGNFPKKQPNETTEWKSKQKASTEYCAHRLRSKTHERAKLKNCHPHSHPNESSANASSVFVFNFQLWILCISAAHLLRVRPVRSSFLWAGISSRDSWKALRRKIHELHHQRIWSF